MQTYSHPVLPDPEAARLLISEVVPRFGPPMAEQALEQAEVVRLFLQSRRLGADPHDVFALCADIFGGIYGPYGNLSWYSRMGSILSPYFSPEAPWMTIGQPWRIVERVNSLKAHLAIFGHPPISVDEIPPNAFRPILSDLHKYLVRLSDAFMALPRPTFPPAVRPPRFARLREDVVAETVSQELAELIEPFQRGHRSGDDLGARNGQGSRAVG
ncbi:hypothetical protein [Streptomyces lavendulae]|uniref:hypothetical protein n=1 Tax=Streptomyces lavendulae TaxID=1914 RepID=UPI0037FFB7C4